METEVTQVLQGRFRTIDGPTVFLKIDTEGDKTRCAGSLFQNVTTRTKKAPLLRRRRLNIDVLRHLPYSRDMASNDLHLLRSLQHFQAEKFFTNAKSIKGFLFYSTFVLSHVKWANQIKFTIHFRLILSEPALIIISFIKKARKKRVH